MIRTVYVVRNDALNVTFESFYGGEVPGQRVVYSYIEFTDKVENVGHTYDVLCPEDPPV